MEPAGRSSQPRASRWVCIGACGALLWGCAPSDPPVSPVIASQFTHTLVVKSDGTLWAWGGNQFGQLGLGSTEDSGVPRQVGKDKDWLSAATGSGFSLALKQRGSLYAWGLNTYGQAGQDPARSPVVPSPTEIPGVWVQAAAGSHHAIGLKRDGTLWAWGYNRHGELGLGGMDPDPHPLPAQVGTDGDWVRLDTNGYHCLATKADGSLWGWGDNTSGQAGQAVPPDGSGDSVLRPARIGADADWAAPVAALFFSLGLKTDGSLWAWGNNTFGQLGFGAADPAPNEPPAAHPVPRRVAPRDAWLSASGGELRGLAVRTDGTLWAWGMLSDESVLGPVRVSDGIHWAAVAGQRTALDRSGTIATWGGDLATPPQAVSGILAGADRRPPSASAAPPPGNYPGKISVALRGTDDSTLSPFVRYTVDGSDPGPASSIYEAPLPVDRTMTVKFLAEDAWGNRSAPVAATYTISAPP